MLWAELLSLGSADERWLQESPVTPEHLCFPSDFSILRWFFDVYMFQPFQVPLLKAWEGQWIVGSAAESFGRRCAKDRSQLCQFSCQCHAGVQCKGKDVFRLCPASLKLIFYSVQPVIKNLPKVQAARIAFTDQQNCCSPKC